MLLRSARYWRAHAQNDSDVFEVFLRRSGIGLERGRDYTPRHKKAQEDALVEFQVKFRAKLSERRARK